MQPNNLIRVASGSRVVGTDMLSSTLFLAPHGGRPKLARTSWNILRSVHDMVILFKLPEKFTIVYF